MKKAQKFESQYFTNAIPRITAVAIYGSTFAFYVIHDWPALIPIVPLKL